LFSFLISIFHWFNKFSKIFYNVIGMLELVILYFLTKEIRRLANRKGVKVFTWQLYTVVAWFFSELLGIIIALNFFSKNNLVSLFLVGILFAITSYFIIKAQLSKLPDHGSDDDIDHIGH
jgi:hypothetical protein